MSTGAAIPARRGFFATLWRATRQFFHEATGAIFAVFALSSIGSAIRAWRSGEPRWLLALPLAYAVIMAYFSFESFLSARRVQ